MRMTLLIAAAALAVAGPAVAQNTAVDTNADAAVADNMAVDANALVAADNGAIDLNAPADVPVTEDVTTTPVPREDKDFPWGVLGLIGLVGLLGRKRG
jgi:hypothetical protein